MANAFPQTARGVALHRPGGSLFERLRADWARWQEVRAVERELSRLTDRELDDIGISRLSIPEIARSAVPPRR